MTPKDDERFSEKEAAWRRDKVVRHMANTPPQPRTKSLSRQAGKKKTTGSGMKYRKPSSTDKGV